MNIVEMGLAGQAAQVAANKLAEYEALVMAHDMSYGYSDDSSVNARGMKEYDAIQALAKEIPQADAIRIWNAAVDKKFIPAVCHEYYMKAAA
jgi:hypothetical protein